MFFSVYCNPFHDKLHHIWKNNLKKKTRIRFFLVFLRTLEHVRKKLCASYSNFVGVFIMESFPAESTLSDVATAEQIVSAPRREDSSATPPEIQNLNTGVSLKYAQPSTDVDIKWYALRASYGTELKARDIIVGKGFEAYVPFIYTREMKQSEHGKRRLVKKMVRKPISNLVFIRASRQEADSFAKNSGENHIRHLHYFYNHLEGLPQGQENPVTISEREMQNFMQVADVDDEHVRRVNLEDCHFKDGDRVRVADGKFKGVEGYVVRAHGEQRIIVGESGLYLVTAYIPTAFIVKL